MNRLTILSGSSGISCCSCLAMSGVQNTSNHCLQFQLSALKINLKINRWRWGAGDVGCERQRRRAEEGAVRKIERTGKTAKNTKDRRAEGRGERLRREEQGKIKMIGENYPKMGVGGGAGIQGDGNW